MNQYLYVIRSPRDDFANTVTAEESAIMAEHYQYLVGLGERIVLAGRTQDDATFGIIVFQAEDDAKAQAIVDADPSVARGVMDATLHPYRVALLQGQPQPK